VKTARLRFAGYSNLNANNLSGDPRLRVGAPGAPMTQDSIERTLGRIEEKLDNLAAATLPRLNNHSERLGSLERGRAWLYGAVATTGFIVGLVLTLWKA
jgi:hypothetical protein